MEYLSISKIDDLRSFCDEIADEPVIGFDTEFVSEDRYRPQLCLIQVAAGDHLALIDPLKMDSTEPFWDLLVQPGKTIIAHAAREESRFCYRYTDQPIAGLFDTQLAAGFCGMEYPISLGNLVFKVVGKSLAKGESRTNWRHRPLSNDQLRYALQDVTDLQAIHAQLSAEVETLKRAEWLREETDRRQQAVIDQETSENWRRVSGSVGLSPRQLEIVRHLWRWRDRRAAAQDRPARRVMRDDLIVELAKRSSSNIKKIRSIRGMEWRGYAAHHEDISAAIQQALEVPDSELPRRNKRTRSVVSPMLTQFV
ncbi:MAG: HRDC domain-containing protein, partial [Planctomycetota bacterium]